MFGNRARIFGWAWVAAAFAWLIACVYSLFPPPVLSAQALDDSIVSKHVRIRIPVERQWLGRETISDLERCWGYIDAATGGKLPSRVLLVIEWRDSIAPIDVERATIPIGMNAPAAETDPKGFLLHCAARELARFALINLSGGGAAKQENRFLLEGLSEMMAHDFSNTVRRLGAAWAICYYLDRMNPLGLKQLPARPEFSGSTHDLRSASAGITFLTTCRELYGQERLLKLFESLAKKNLEKSLAASFKAPSASLETQWLARVRKYTPADLTITTEQEAPVLDRAVFIPNPGKTGATLGMRLFARHGTNDLTPAGVFIVDESSGRVLQGREGDAADGRSLQFEIPIDPARPEGRYRLRVVAVDEGGNVRNWEAFYAVAR